MKKILLGVLFTGLLMAAIGRTSDKDWDIATVTLNAEAKRIVNAQTGMLWVENHGADSYIAFNATADATSTKIPDGGNIDFYPASIKYGEYFTVYSAGSTYINYVILD
jgi:hypothetical protein